MINIEILEATINDIEVLQKIGRQTFSETFAASNSSENMTQYLETGFSTEKLLTELANTNAVFYIVKSENEVVGYLKLNFGDAQTELKDSKALEIERIYIAKAFQGKNIGQLLYEKAMQVATQKNVEYVWLGVWEENQKAINFYKKNGFEAFEKHLFKLGDDEQTDIMMKLKIKQ
jgi:ribosomal protein S18 acetylase RimI-like enzyme